MPEPRETHTAIDARRNAERGGASERDALIEYLAVGIASALDRYPLINLERGEYDAIAGTAARSCVDAGFVPTDSATRVEEVKAERDALAATVQRVRDLCDRWEREGRWRNSGTGTSPADTLRAALAPSDPATDTEEG